MRMKKTVLTLFFTLAFLSACGGENVKNPSNLLDGQDALTIAPTPIDNSDVSTGSIEDNGISGGVLEGADADSVGQAITDTGDFLAHIIYFDLDQITIKSEYLASLNGHAAYLIKTPSALVRLAGHTDERGTREYNIALGERRGNAVKRYLQLQGVSEDSIDVVSYGEERPVNEGHDESYWSENRRVEIHYENK